MAFREPFAAYNAASNIEAHLVCGALLEAGVEAKVVEDVSQIGTWMGGSVPELHKPQVWIEKADIPRAKPVLDAYEERESQRRAAELKKSASGEWIVVRCEDCGRETNFTAQLAGTVQNCPHCRAFLDVAQDEDDEDWGEEE